MAKYRVSFALSGEEQDKRSKSWPTLEEARAFFSGLKQGRAAKNIRIHQLEKGRKGVRIPYKQDEKASEAEVRGED